MNKDITINKDQRLYVIPCGEGYTTLGFDYAYTKAEKIAKHYGITKLYPSHSEIGTPLGYAEYMTAITYAQREHARTGLKCPIELNPQLIGYEGKRVAVRIKDGPEQRFTVGKSTGWIPCHLWLERSNASGGHAISADIEFSNIRVIK